ncbi:DUF5959 family protein [Streptomyces sp. NPDC048197]|uniref:DUF5959 family protein n=1 Tax=Streptomyces sp. NPDC048197 TaxID=3365511 RepID=UPI00371B5D8B
MSRGGSCGRTDESGSMVTVRVPVVPPDDWIADHRQRLRRVLDHWAPCCQRRETSWGPSSTLDLGPGRERLDHGPHEVSFTSTPAPGSHSVTGW